jgi:hypothetical protein
MLCLEIEKGKEMCANYYSNSDNENDALEFGEIKIQFISKKEKFPGFMIRKLMVSNSKGE